MEIFETQKLVNVKKGLTKKTGKLFFIPTYVHSQMGWLYQFRPF